MSSRPHPDAIPRPPQPTPEKELTPADHRYLDRAFVYHAPKPLQPIKYQILRARARELAVEIIRLCPDKEERVCALVNLEQALMWANASIARWE